MQYIYKYMVFDPKNTKPQNKSNSALSDSRDMEQLKCPRCDSQNTKFCYFNNYSLSQPRHLCKDCKRYWTQGGILRNVPIGARTRKPRRPRSSTWSSASTGPQSPSQSQTQPMVQNQLFSPSTPINSIYHQGGGTGGGARYFSHPPPQPLPKSAVQNQLVSPSPVASRTHHQGHGIGVGYGNFSWELPQPLPQPLVQNQLVSPSPPTTNTYDQGSETGSGGGYLSSLAGFQSLNMNPPQPFNQALNTGGVSSVVGYSVPIATLLSGFPDIGSFASPDYQQSQFHPMSVVGNNSLAGHRLIPPSVVGNNVVAASHNPNWPHGFINSDNNLDSYGFS